MVAALVLVALVALVDLDLARPQSKLLTASPTTSEPSFQSTLKKSAGTKNTTSQRPNSTATTSSQPMVKSPASKKEIKTVELPSTHPEKPLFMITPADGRVTSSELSIQVINY